jgi:NAD(P)-dependent dehydrogenase (short-subunit alcohol dehydrogenase family)
LPLTDRTILLTGATDGLGRACALDLAGRGATLLLHGRDPAKGRATLDEIASHTGSDRLHWYQADLSSLEQVRSLAEQVRTDHKRLDVLINNAGIGASVPGGGRRQESADGFELRFAVNYLAGFLLTRLLWPLLESSAPARVVNVASAGQQALDFDDVMLLHDYSGRRAYNQSKLAQIMHAFDLAEGWPASGVAATSLHPATFMPTKIVANPITPIEVGVEATDRLATRTAPDDVNGRYFDVKDEAKADAQAYDGQARRRLRELSLRLTGLHT